MLNTIILQGRLTRDPELRNTEGGHVVASFGVAVDRQFTDGQGNRATDFINVVAWRKTAEFVGRYFHKGDEILLQGSLQVREYTDQQNQRRTIYEVVADNVNFCGPKRETQQQPAPAPAPAQAYHQPAAAATAAQAYQQPAAQPRATEDDVLPFDF